ncbi:MAG: glycosyltransferase [Phycisphaerales bacterium]|nr:glycosyltransferase [Phycisphaerales bacterium]
MRVLHVLTSIDPSTGGPANVLSRLARVQAQRGHVVRVITADDPATIGAVTEQMRLAGVEHRGCGPMHGPLGRGPATRREMEAALRAGVDIAHVHGVWQHTPHAGAAAARAAGVPYIMRPCGMLDPWSLRQGRLKKRIFLALVARRHLNRAAALHYTTETERRLAEPLGLRSPTFVIPNGLDWDEFEPLPPRGAFRAAHGIGERTLIVFLSRVHHKKGLGLLLPALARLPDAGVMLAVVGPGEARYITELRARAAALGVGDRVIFPGMIVGRARLEALRDADLFCLPSFQENFGVSVIEALGVGTPVLISDQVNICAEVAAAEVGEVVPCEVEPLARRLATMLADRPRLAEMAARARPWVERTFRWDAIAARIDAMYEQVVHARRADAT